MYVKSDIGERVPDHDIHKEPITRILYWPSGMSSEKDKYITCEPESPGLPCFARALFELLRCPCPAAAAKDGTIRIWNSTDMSLHKSFVDGTAWVTDISLLPRTNRLVACNFNRTIKLYDINSGDVCGGASDLESAPFTLESWYHNRMQAELVLAGDISECIGMFSVLPLLLLQAWHQSPSLARMRRLESP